jgi:hypothetical protein
VSTATRQAIARTICRAAFAVLTAAMIVELFHPSPWYWITAVVVPLYWTAHIYLRRTGGKP